MIYLDNAATTRIRPEVLGAMMPYLTGQYGNPGGLYRLGREAREAVERAREQAAALFHCEPRNVVFTSGGSEGNNMVLRGAAKILGGHGCKKMAVSSVEHESVLRTAKSIGADTGMDILLVGPDASGRITPESIPDTVMSGGLPGFLSVMYVNNETGVVNNIPFISDVYHNMPEEYTPDSVRLMHSDCVQAAGNYDIDVNRLGVDFATISSHKIHGPKGVGAVYVRDFNSISPLICGGSDQEFGLRGGTENVAGVVGFGKACEIALATVEENQMHYMLLRDRFLDTLAGSLGKDRVTVNGASSPIGKALNVRINGVDSQSLILMLSDTVCVSAGSACSSHSTRPSHVLKAMGMSDDECMESFRVSFSSLSTEEEAETAAAEIAKAAAAIEGVDKLPDV